MLFVGPHAAIKLRGKLQGQVGLALTFAGYKFKVEDSSNSVSSFSYADHYPVEVQGVSVPATSVELRTKRFSALGLMPFARLKFDFDNLGIFGFIGYNTKSHL
jgi:hypothetical protein